MITKKLISASLASFFVLSLILNFSGCSNFYDKSGSDGVNEIPAATKTAGLQITLPYAPSAARAADDSGKKYFEVTLTKSDDATKTETKNGASGETISFLNKTPGIYVLEAKVYNEESRETLYATGKDSKVELVASKINVVTLTLSTIKGEVNISVAWERGEDIGIPSLYGIYNFGITGEYIYDGDTLSDILEIVKFTLVDPSGSVFNYSGNYSELEPVTNEGKSYYKIGSASGFQDSVAFCIDLISGTGQQSTLRLTIFNTATDKEIRSEEISVEKISISYTANDWSELRKLSENSSIGQLEKIGIELTGDMIATDAISFSGRNITLVNAKNSVIKFTRGEANNSSAIFVIGTSDNTNDSSVFTIAGRGKTGKIIFDGGYDGDPQTQSSNTLIKINNGNVTIGEGVVLRNNYNYTASFSPTDEDDDADYSLKGPGGAISYNGSGANTLVFKGQIINCHGYISASIGFQGTSSIKDNFVLDLAGGLIKDCTCLTASTGSALRVSYATAKITGTYISYETTKSPFGLCSVNGRCIVSDNGAVFKKKSDSSSTVGILDLTLNGTTYSILPPSTDGMTDIGEYTGYFGTSVTEASIAERLASAYIE